MNDYTASKPKIIHTCLSMLFLLYVIIIGIYKTQPAYGAGYDNHALTMRESIFIDSGSFNTFADAYAYAKQSNTSKTLVITRNEVINGITTIDEGINIVVMEGAYFVKGIGGKLIIKGNFSAPLCQVFKDFSPGEVVFKAGAVKEVYPHWWGAKNGIDSTNAIQNAMQSLEGGGRVYFAKGIYLISRTLRVPSNITLIGEAFADNDADAAAIKMADGVNSDMIRNYSYPETNAGISIESLVLLGNKASNKQGKGLNFKKVNWFYCNKFWVMDCPDTGIYLDTVNAAHLDNSRVASCDGDGVHAIGGSSHTYTNLNSEMNKGNGIHISNTTNLSNYTVIGYYSEQCGRGIYINGRGVLLLGGRINDCKNADLYLEDSNSVYDVSVIGLVCQTVKPKTANIFIGKQVSSTFMFNVFGPLLINHADVAKVRILRQDAYGRLSMNGLEFDQNMNAVIKHLGNDGLQFTNENAFLSIVSNILTLNSQSSVNIKSTAGDINLYPGVGSSINAAGVISTSSGVKFAPVRETDVPISCLFVDIHDHRLKFKDNSGHLIPLQ